MSGSRDNAGGGGPSTRALTIFPIATGTSQSTVVAGRSAAVQPKQVLNAGADPEPQAEAAAQHAPRGQAQSASPPAGRLAGLSYWLVSHIRRSRAAKAALILAVVFVAAFVLLWNVAADDIQRLGLMLVFSFLLLAACVLYLAYRTLGFARRLSAENQELRQRLQETAEKFAGFEHEMRASSARQSTTLGVVAARVERATAQRIAEIAELAQEVTLESSNAIGRLEGRLLSAEQALVRKGDAASLEDVKAGLARLAQTVNANARDADQKIGRVEAGLLAGGAAHDALRAAIAEQAHQAGALIDEFESALASKADAEAHVRLKAAVDEVAGLARELATTMQADAKALADMRALLTGKVGAIHSQIGQIQATQAGQAQEIRGHIAASEERIGEFAVRLEGRLREFAAQLGAKAEHHAIALIGSQVAEMTVLTEQAVRQAFVEIDLLKQKAPPEGLSAREIAIIKSRTIASEKALKELGARFEAIEAALGDKDAP
jgi:hypothetical protein